MNLSIKPLKTKKSKIKNRLLMDEKIVMNHPSNTLISAAPGSGKSCLIVNLLTKGEFYGPSYELMSDEEKKDGKPPKPYFDAVFLFLPSGDDAYDPLIRKKIILPAHVCINPSANVIQNVIDTQKKAIKDSGDISKSPKILCIFDDCVKERKMLESEPFRTLFSQSRHLNCSNIVTTQYLNLIPRSVRMMCEWLLVFKLNRLEMDILSDAYSPPLMSKTNFKKMVHNVTSDTPDNKHNFLLICRTITDINKKFRKNFDQYIKVEEQLDLHAPRFSKKKMNEYMKKEEYDDEDEKEVKEEPFDPVVSNKNEIKDKKDIENIKKSIIIPEFTEENQIFSKVVPNRTRIIRKIRG
ncbi:MAG: Poxvirus protein [Nitrososphaeraceae archaeon]|jgi:hypothetical protein|nr:Poxvirus protein [Nitrososphaeraceae archaeon]